MLNQTLLQKDKADAGNSIKIRWNDSDFLIPALCVHLPRSCVSGICIYSQFRAALAFRTGFIES